MKLNIKVSESIYKQLEKCFTSSDTQTKEEVQSQIENWLCTCAKNKAKEFYRSEVIKSAEQNLLDLD